jgi:cobalt transporter subunit CbtA
MPAFRRIVFAAALAGLVAGGAVTVLHHFGTVSLILEAEVYEQAADAAAADMAADGSTAASGEATHDHGDHAWAPADGFERTAFTLLADVVTGIGFALLLVAGFALRGGEIGWRQGLFWGLAGFATFTLAPGLGLPPEVPGTESAPLVDRQIWWVATALATGAGLALLFLVRRAAWAVVGLLLILLPHLYGAPQPAEFRSAAPELIAREFVVAAVSTSFVFWALLGALSGYLYDRLGRAAATRAAPSPA